MTTENDDIYAREQFAADDPRLPETFQVYRVKRRLGQGPVSFVYEVARLDSRRTVRLKVLRKRIAHLDGIEQEIAALDRELRVYTGEHLLGYHGLGRHDDNVYLEFEFVEAVSLRELIDDEAPFHPDLAALLALGIIEGLTDIHGAKPSPGMGNLIPLHQNLKPENILIGSSGQVKLTDIGMSRVAAIAEKGGLELAHTPLCYQAPEQLLRDYADRRSDIFSLGMVMTEMVGKRLPYVGRSIHHSRQNIRENQRRKTKELLAGPYGGERRRLIAALAAIIDRMTAHAAEKRTDQLIQIESLLLKFLEGTSYRDHTEELAEFVESRSFVSQRRGRPGFWQRLLGKRRS
jgi:serine/threonine protein kinase